MPPRRRRPRGHIRTLPSGSFQAIVYAADPLTGKERYLRETTKTYDAAEIALTRLQGQVDEDRHPKSAITLGQAIAQWLDVAELARGHHPGALRRPDQDLHQAGVRRRFKARR